MNLDDLAKTLESDAQKMGKTFGVVLGETNINAIEGAGEVEKNNGSQDERMIDGSPVLFNRKAPQYVRQQELPWHRVALERAAKGYTAREIAAQLGCSPTAVQDILRQPQYQHLQVALIGKEMTEDQRVVETIRTNVVKAVKTLAEIMESDKTKPADRIAAARELLNRRYGMPNQPINRNTDVDLNKLSDEELAGMLTQN